MRSREAKVAVEASGSAVSALRGMLLREAADRAGVVLQTSSGWQGTVVVLDDHFIGLEIDDTSKNAYGVVVDLGTTTVVGTLFDFVTEEEKAVC